MSFSDAPISFPGLFGDWQFTVPSKALNIGNGIYWYGVLITIGVVLAYLYAWPAPCSERTSTGTASSLPRACCWDSISA